MDIQIQIEEKNERMNEPSCLIVWGEHCLHDAGSRIIQIWKSLECWQNSVFPYLPSGFDCIFERIFQCECDHKFQRVQLKCVWMQTVVFKSLAGTRRGSNQWSQSIGACMTPAATKIHLQRKVEDTRKAKSKILWETVMYGSRTSLTMHGRIEFTQSSFLPKLARGFPSSHPLELVKSYFFKTMLLKI